MSGRGSRLTLVVLCLVAASVVACETQDYTPDATMQAMPESHLAPVPDATLLVQGATPRRHSPEEGTDAAYLIRKFGTNATKVEVIAHYASLLAPLGWRHPCASCQLWQKPGYEFEITTDSPEDLPSAERGYGLVYTEILREVLSLPTRTARTSLGYVPGSCPCTAKTPTNLAGHGHPSST